MRYQSYVNEHKEQFVSLTKLKKSSKLSEEFWNYGQFCNFCT